MKSADIKVGETYRFMGSESPTRAHLAGQEFTVVNIENVWRRLKRGRRKVKRFFNEDGVGARADELEPLDDTEITCSHCNWKGPAKEMALDDTRKNPIEVCPNCGENPDPF